MRNNHLIAPWICFLTVCGSIFPADASPEIHALRFATPQGMSPDGSIVVGTASNRPFLWRDGTLETLPGVVNVQGVTLHAQARGVSADGAIIAGLAERPRSFDERFFNIDEAARWVQGEIETIGGVGGVNYDFQSRANEISADGSTIVGVSVSGPGSFQPTLWRADGTIMGLGDLDPSDHSQSGEAFDVSNDGSVVVGWATGGIDVGEAFRWQDGVMIGLGILPHVPYSSSRAIAVNGDGSVIVGRSASGSSGFEAFRWEAGTMVGLGDFVGGAYNSSANAVTDDGQIVVGRGESESGDEAFLWTADGGMVRLADHLVQEFQLDLDGWTLEDATLISADGSVIAGTGRGPLGRAGWIVITSELAPVQIKIDVRPGSVDNTINPMSRGLIPVAILSGDAIDVQEIDASSLEFGPGGAAPVYRVGGHLEDVNGDGLLELVSHYSTEDAGVAFGDVEVCLIGTTLDTTQVEGCDAIQTVPKCGDGFGLALAVPLMWWIRRRV